MASRTRKSGGYGQYCPLALAAELLCRRWTVLVVSRLLDGCTTFTEIHRGMPRISPSLLSSRLQELERAGLIVRSKVRGKDRHNYALTEAGKDLDGIINQLAVWGQHWARDNEMDDLDIEFLAWSMSQRLNAVALPAGRTVVEFEFTGVPDDFKRFWLVSNDGNVDMCIKYPGFDTDLLVKADLRRFVETWRGFRDLHAELNSSRIRLTGADALKRAFPNWLLLSGLAPYRRKVRGREQRISNAGNAVNESRAR